MDAWSVPEYEAVMKDIKEYLEEMIKKCDINLGDKFQRGILEGLDNK